jgi:hypothetical protein
MCVVISYIPFEGRVDLRIVDDKFWVIETDDQVSNNRLPPVIQRTFFFFFWGGGG